jgi:hypothetical protein
VINLSKEVASDLSKQGYCVDAENVQQYVDDAVLLLSYNKEISLPVDSWDDQCLVVQWAKKLYWDDRHELDFQAW